MIKRTLKVLKGVNGSAIIAALVTTVILATLALAIISLTMANLSQSQTDALNNDAYYAAESGVNSALDQLKQEVLDYYNDMMEAESGQYGSLYDNFFSNINNNARADFMEPVFDGLTTQTTFTTGNFNSADNICEFLISSTATAADKSKYRVDAKLYVKRVDVSVPTWLTIDDVAYKIGESLNLFKGYGVYNGGSVITGAFNNPNNVYFFVQPPGKFLIDPNIGSTINDCLTYPSYTDPVVGTADYTIRNNTVFGTTAKNGEIPLPTNRPVVIVTELGYNPTIEVNGSINMYPGSVIINRGTGLVYLHPSMPGPGTFSCYSVGPVKTTNGAVYANIYCRGNVSTENNFHGNIVCDGNVTESCNTFVGTILCKGSITCSGGLKGSFFAEGPINISSGVSGNSVIYSKEKISLGAGNYANAVLFSGGDIDVNGGSSMTGAVIAAGSVNQNAWLTLNYSRAAIEAIMNDPMNSWFFSGAGGNQEELNDESVIINQEVTAVGRQ